jgi:predicted DNA-binding antitoxin AbrB/MazE fold protein
MAEITEAIFSGGVLKPLEDLALREAQRVRLIVEPIDEVPADRQAALKKLLAGIESMQLRSTGKLPSRDELHDRV